MTTEATQLTQIQGRRAALSQQIAKYDQELAKVGAQMIAVRQKAMAKGQDLPYPVELIKQRDTAAHARAALVKEDQQLHIQQTTLGRTSRKSQEDLDAIEAQIADWAEILDLVEDVKDKLNRIDRVMIRSPQYQGVPQNACHQMRVFLEKPTALLERAAALRARVHEIGLPSEDDSL